MASKRTRGDLAQEQRRIVEQAASDTTPDPAFPDVQFASQEQKGKFVLFKRRPLAPTKFICRTSMRTLGLDRETEALFAGVGMKAMYNLNEPTYPVLTWEFLSSFKVRKNKTTGLVTEMEFRIKNQTYTLALSFFARIFGLENVPNHRSPDEIHYSSIWKAISGLDDKVGVKRPETSVHNAAIRVWHRFMGCAALATDEPWHFRANELEILGSYLFTKPKPYKINIAHHMAAHLAKIANSPGQKVPIHVGGIITKIAKGVERHMSFENMHFLVGDQFITKLYMEKLEWLKQHPVDGKEYWQIQKRNSIPLPNPTKMQIKKDQVSYLLELEAIPDPNRPPANVPITFGRDATTETTSGLQYQMPTVTPLQPPPFMPQQPPWYPQFGNQFGEGSSSQPQQPLPPFPLPQQLLDWMEKMDLSMAKAASERDLQNRRMDRIYMDQALGQFPIYDEFCRRGYNHPSGTHPSYYLAPDGGYPQNPPPNAPIVYGDLNINPDYFSQPIFPSTQHGEGTNTQWYSDGTPSVFGEGGTIGASSMSGGLDMSGDLGMGGGFAMGCGLDLGGGHSLDEGGTGDDNIAYTDLVDDEDEEMEPEVPLVRRSG